MLDMNRYHCALQRASKCSGLPSFGILSFCSLKIRYCPPRNNCGSAIKAMIWKQKCWQDYTTYNPLQIQTTGTHNIKQLGHTTKCLSAHPVAALLMCRSTVADVNNIDGCPKWDNFQALIENERPAITYCCQRLPRPYLPIKRVWPAKGHG